MELPKDIYLDTNIILPYFTNLVQNKPQPKVFSYLYNVKKKYHYFVPNLTKVEVFRKLHSEYKVEEKRCRQLWDLFKKALSITELELREMNLEEIAVLAAQRPAKRGMTINIIHLLFAKHNNLIVLTGDKPLKDRFKVFYTNVLDYEEFRKL